VLTFYWSRTAVFTGYSSRTTLQWWTFRLWWHGIVYSLDIMSVTNVTQITQQL